MQDKEVYQQYLNRIIRKKATEYHMQGMQKQSKENVVSFCLEDYHLFYTIETDLDAWDLNLQWVIELEENQFRLLIFVDPIMFETTKRKQGACILANDINSRMKIPGKYSVYMDKGDFVYDLIFPYELLETMPEFVEKSLFDWPIQFWETIHIPLVMFAHDIWPIDLASDYLTTLMDQGWIDNGPYGL